MKKRVNFCDVKIGEEFSFSGIEYCTKKSSRTAYINKEKTLWFYFGKNELCYV